MEYNFDYRHIDEDIFYKVIYPLFAKEFLFGNDYLEFTSLLNKHFILNQIQMDAIDKHWNYKENILKLKYDQ